MFEKLKYLNQQMRRKIRIFMKNTNRPRVNIIIYYSDYNTGFYTILLYNL